VWMFPRNLACFAFSHMHIWLVHSPLPLFIFSLDYSSWSIFFPYCLFYKVSSATIQFLFTTFYSEAKKTFIWMSSCPLATWKNGKNGLQN
jgi:hypothetical protein